MLTGGTSYTYKAYRDSTCTRELATASGFRTLATPTLAASAVTNTTATLTISNWTQAWYYKHTTGTCSTEVAANTLTASLTTLTASTSYTYTAYSDSSCTAGNEVAVAAAFTTKAAAPALASSAVTNTTATLTVSNWDDPWYYKHTTGTCSTTAVAANTSSVDLSDLAASTSYTYSAYRDSGCNTSLAAASAFTTKAAAPSLASSAVGDTTATLTISNWDDPWYYKYTTPEGGTCSTTAVAAGTAAVNLTMLTSNTSYTYKAYRDSACSTELATAPSFTTQATPTLVVSAVTNTTATLTISNWTQAWHYQHTTGTCSTEVAANTLTASLTTLTASTSYTYTAYSDSSCTGGKEIAATPAFTTQAAGPTLASSAVTDTTATLTISNWDDPWYYKHTTGTCSTTAVAANTPSVDLTTLTASTSYTYSAYRDSGCATLLAAASAFTTKAAAPTLAASAITGTTATLTISNWDDPWHYKHTTPPGGVCSNVNAAGTLTADLTGLLGTTFYTFKAYRDSGCSKEVVTAPSFTTLATATLAVSAVTNTTAILTISNWTQAWYHKHTTGACSTEVAANTPTASVATLTASTSYTFSAYSESGCVNVRATAASFTTKAAAPALSVSAITDTTATLTISNWDDPWYHKHTTGTCSTNAVPANTLTASLTTLTASTSYTFTAYRDSGCSTGNEVAVASAFTTKAGALALAASSVTDTTATLTLSNWTDPWYYKYTSPSGGTCSSAVAANTSTVNLTTLTAATSYTYTAYRDSGCATALATAGFTTDGLAFSSTGVQVAEGGSVSYTVELATQPTAQVKVTITKTGDSNITFTVTDCDTATGGTQLCFSTTDWSTPQTVTVSATADTDDAAGSATLAHTVASTDSSYNNLAAASVTATEVDQDSCKNSTATPSDSPATLVTQCGILLAAKDALGGTTLNWNKNHAITSWEGVNTLGGQVTSLSLSGKSLTGRIPATLGNLTKLLSLDLSSNSLTGPIPSTLGNLTKVGTLDLSSNGLTGPIPSTLGNLVGLHYLYLDSNSLTGSIPSALGNAVRLLRLHLQGNALTGSIPSTLGSLTQLRQLKLSANTLTGSIPAEVANMSSLEELQLGNNALTGSIPSALGNLEQLTWLDLSQNDMTGSIPSTFGDLTQLALSNNRLSGCIPYSYVRHKSSINPQQNSTNLSICGLSLTISGLSAGFGALTVQTVTFTFDRSVIGFTAADVTVTNGTKGTLSGSGAVWTMPVTASASLTQGDQVTVTVAANSVTDLSDSTVTGPASAVSATGTYDTRALSAGSVTHNSATLTISGHTAVWYYKYTSPTGGTCSSMVPANTLTANLSTLTSGVTYTYQAYSDSGCTAAIGSPVTFTTVAVTISLTSMTVLEGASDTYTINLATQPSHDVKVTIARTSGDSNVTFSITDCDSVTAGEQLCFSTSTWSTPQTVTVSPTEDNDALNGMATLGHTVSSTDAGYNNLTAPSVTVTEEDNDACKNSTATPAASSAGLVTDCSVLLVAKDDLEGTTGTLNWSKNLAIADWDGVGVSNGRVTRLNVPGTNSGGNTTILNGVIPPILGDLTALTSLLLDHHNLAGAIPPRLGNLTNLTRLSLTTNRLTGSIPSALGKLTKLTELTLGGNRLTGNLPAEMANMTKLSILWLSGNDLSGSIPSFLGNLRISYLNLVGNRFSGPIPPELGNPSLQHLSLAANNLTGPIPDNLKKAPIQSLSLSANQLTGPIPTWLADKPNLDLLDLSWNYFTGTIPQGLADLKHLYRLSLYRNNLTGCVPLTLVRVTLANPQRDGSSLGSCGPDVTISGVPEKFTGTTPMAVIFTFDRWVSGFTASDITVTNGTKGTLTGSGAVWTMPVTPSSSLTEGQKLTVTVAANSVDDATGFANTLTQGPHAAESVEGTYTAITLTASNVTNTSATLTISGHNTAWWYQRQFWSGATCESVTSGTTASLSSLPTNTLLTYQAYSDSGCTTDLGLPVQFPSRSPSLAASAVTNTTATLTLRYWGNDWWYKYTTPSGDTSCTKVAKGNIWANTVALTNRTASTSYVYKAYSTAGCSSTNLIATAPSFTTKAAAPALTGTAKTDSTAVLSLSNWDDAWSYKRTVPSLGYCFSVKAGNPLLPSKVLLVNLDANTSYTYVAYRDRACTEQLAAAAPFTTEASPPTVSVSAITDETATLTVANWDDEWYYWQQLPTAEFCNSTEYRGATSASLTDLTPGQSQLFTVYEWGRDESGEFRCYDEIGTVTFTTVGLVLSSTLLDVPEGSSDTYTIKLATQPTHAVKVTITSTGDSDLTVSVTDCDTSTTGDQLCFSTTNWSTPQTVTVSAAEDGDSLHGTRTLSHAAVSTDTNYNGLATVDLTVREVDKDTCVNSTATPSGSSADLVSDCNTLLGAKDDLTGGTRTLNWSKDLAIASWEGITVENGRVTKLELLPDDWDDPVLTGVIPPTLGNLTALTVLNLAANSLTGTIPSTLGNLTELTLLMLAWNVSLSGTIPSTLGNLTKLESLFLDYNSLSGAIPSTLGNLTKLKNLTMAFTGIGGSLPSTLQNLTDLELIDFEEARLTGPIPSWLGNLTNLTYVNFLRNRLTGSIPSTLGNLHKLTELHLSQNRLTDPIPSTLGNLKKLERLGLASNRLTGSIPISLGWLPKDNDVFDTASLELLYLGDNYLTGCAPHWLRNSRGSLRGNFNPQLPNNLEKCKLDVVTVSGLPAYFNTLTAIPIIFTFDDVVYDSTTSLQFSDFTVSGGVIQSFDRTHRSIEDSYRVKVSVLPYSGLAKDDELTVTLAAQSIRGRVLSSSPDGRGGAPYTNGPPVARSVTGRYDTRVLTAGSVTNDSAQLSISNHNTAWWLKGNQQGATCQAVVAGTTSATVTNLTGGTSYVYKAYADSSCTTPYADSASFTTQAAGAALASASIIFNAGTLTLSNYAGAWSYKYTTPTGGRCSNVAAGTSNVSLVNLLSSTAYSFNAYRGTGCSGTPLASTSFTTSSAPKLAVSDVTDTTATLTLSNWSPAWYYQRTLPTGGTCTSVAMGTSTVSLTTLTASRSYIFKAYSDAKCTTALAAAPKFTTYASAPTLAASEVTNTTATLTLSNWGEDWWYKYTTPSGDTSCTMVAKGTSTKALTGLDANKAYVYKSYRESTCNTVLATASSFTTFAAAPALAASDVTNSTATLTLSNWRDDWWYKYTTGAGSNTCTKVTGDSGGVTSAGLTGRTASTAYVYQAYRDSGCSVDLATASSFTTYAAAPALVGSDVTDDTATLTLSSWAEDWWYKYTTPSGDTSCTKVTGSSGGTTTAAVSGLDASTSYVYKAYRNDDCDVDLATASSFTTFAAAPSLAASDVTNDTATLTLSSWAEDWWYKYTTPSGDTSCTKVTGEADGVTTVSLSSLDASTSYVYEAYRNDVCDVDLATASSFTTYASAPSLAVSDVTNSTATLTLSSWAEDWWYKYTTPSGDNSCTKVAKGTSTASLTSLDANKAYVYKAYRDNSCSTVLATASSFTTYAAAPSLAVSDVTNSTATLTLSSWAEAWWYKYTTPSGDNSCTKVTGSSGGTTTKALTSLDASTAYVYKAYRDSSCGTVLATASSFTTFASAPALAGSDVTDDTATLTLSNWAEDWWYKYTTPTGDNSCTKVTGDSGGTTTKGLTGLDASTAYVYAAYRDSGCSVDLATASSFTTYGAAPALAVSDVTNSTATLTLSSWAEDWWYRYTTPSGDTSCTKVAKGTNTKALTSLDASKAYVYKAYRDSSCSTVLATASQFTTYASAPALAASDVTNTTATLTLSSWAEDWWYKYTTGSGGNTCTKVTGESDGVTSAGLTGRTASTAYVYKAYRDSSCSTELATASSFTTFGAAPALASSDVTDDTATLTLSNWAEDWWYKYTTPSGDTSCTKVAKGTTTKALTGLDASTSYVYEAYRNDDCDVDLATASSFTTYAAAPALAASEVTNTTATLTLSNWAEAWWYRYTTPIGDTSCTSVAKGTNTASLTSLDSNKAYLYRAFRNSGCSTILATAAQFRTFGAAPALAGSDVTDDTATLTLSNWRDEWWYKYTTPSGDNTCTKVTGSSGGKTTAAVSGLDASTGYVYKAYRDSGCSTDLATASQFTTYAAAPSLAASDVTNTTATLTLSNWAEDWWFKYTTGSGGNTCTKVTGEADGVTSAGLTGRTASTAYVYRAYRHSGCTTVLATAPSFTTYAAAPALAASQVTNTTATLTLSNWVEDWWYKYTTPSGDTSCTKVAKGTSTKALTSLDSNKAYVYKAYRDSSCTTLLATASSFTTFAAAPALVGSDVTNTTATLTLSNWKDDWWYKYTTPSGDTSCTKVTGHSGGTTTKALTGLDANKAYVYEAYRNDDCDVDLATASSFTTFGAAPSLAASDVTNTTATLTLSSWAEDWWYKFTKGSGSNSCTKVTGHSSGTTTKALTGRTASTAYVYEAYRNSGCSVDLATADEFTTFGAAPALAVSDVTDDTATLTLSNWREDWWYKYTTPSGDTSCTKVTGSSGGTTTAAVSGLDASTSYVYEAYRNDDCDVDLATASSFTTFGAAPALAASDVTDSTATLTLSNWAEDWWYKYTTPSGDTSCTKVTGSSGGTTTATLSSLDSNKAYVYEAYRNDDCDVDLATASSFTTYAAAPSLAASDVTNTTATLTLSNWAEDWWYKYTTGSGSNTCTKVTGEADGVTTNSLSSLTANKVYVYRAYRNSGCTTVLATAAQFTTYASAPALAASQVTNTTATLTLSNWAEDWWYKYTTPTGDTSCTKVAKGTSTKALTGLDSNKAALRGNVGGWGVKSLVWG